MDVFFRRPRGILEFRILGNVSKCPEVYYEMPREDCGGIKDFARFYKGPSRTDQKRWRAGALFCFAKLAIWRALVDKDCKVL